MCSLCRKALRDPKVVSFPDSQPKPQPVLKQHSALIDVLMIALIALLGLLAVNYLDGQTAPPVAPSVQHERRAFWIATGIDYAATFADAAVSSRSHFAPGLGSCHEVNPLYGGQFPTARRYWLQMSAQTTAVAAVSLFLRRRHHAWFVLLPAADTLLHATGAAATAGRCLP